MVSLAVIAVVLKLVEFFLGSLFDRSRWVRRKLLAEQYIEGTWFDIMRRGGKPVEIGVSRLRYKDFTIRFSGEDYNIENDPGMEAGHCSPFDADMVHFNGEVLAYKYTARRSDDANITTQGYGELQFFSVEDGAPSKYSGSYFVLQCNEKMCFEGFKLDEKADAEALDLFKRGRTREALRVLWSQQKQSRTAALPARGGAERNG
ncbi:MAG: hypothetical protein WD696_16660 [Bryobacteraceae bacterium]